MPFWPQSSDYRLVFRIAYTCQETLPLAYKQKVSTLLGLDNKYGVIIVDFQESNSSCVIVCHEYEEHELYHVAFYLIFICCPLKSPFASLASRGGIICCVVIHQLAQWNIYK